MKARDSLPILVVGILFAGAIYSQESHDGALPGWNTNLAQALADAKKQHRLVMVDFGATWCGPCQEYKQKLFPTDGFKKLSQDVLLVDVDIDKQADLAKAYGVGPIPDIRFFDPDGKEIGQVIGVTDPNLLLLDLARHKEEIAKPQS